MQKLDQSRILHVVIVISNPICYKKRYQLFEEFIDRYKNNPQIVLHATELQQGDKPYATSADFQLRTEHEVWHKENLINLTIQRLPDDWKYVAWIDADIEFHNEQWAQDTIDALQHYKVVQLFSHAIDLGPNDEAFGLYSGFGYDFCKGYDFRTKKLNYKGKGHTGYAWAISKDTFNKIGGLVDFAILGSADAHMAHAFINQVHKSYHDYVHSNYKKMLDIFQTRCQEAINMSIGYVRGTILHHWHGKKRDRQYVSRWKTLVEHQYDPLMDIYRDDHGLIQLSHRKPELRKALQIYFRCRNEDSVDLD